MLEISYKTLMEDVLHAGYKTTRAIQINQVHPAGQKDQVPELKTIPPGTHIFIASVILGEDSVDAFIDWCVDKKLVSGYAPVTELLGSSECTFTAA